MTAEEKNQDNFESDRPVNVVGMNKGKRITVLVLAAVAIGLVYYFFFAGSKDTSETEKPQTTEEDINKLLKTAKPVTQETAPRVNITSQLPELPPLVTPSILPSSPIEKPQIPEKPSILELPKLIQPPQSALPLPPSITPIIPNSPITATSSTGYNKERRGTAMLTISNGNSNSNKNESDNLDINTPLQNSSAAQSRATKVSNLGLTIIQGKIFDAILETAINSDLNGVLRAILSRDVYAEAGNTILIPKGSRLVGSYSLDNKAGQERVNVIWNRLILPHGVDIDISSPGTDELGRQGLTGIVDYKIRNILTSSILVTAISFGTAIGASKIPGLSDQSIIIKPDPDKPGEQVTKTSLPYHMISQALNDLSDTMKSLVKKNINTDPTVYVDQGTLVKVFVNKDLVFPAEAINGIKVVH